MVLPRVAIYCVICYFVFVEPCPALRKGINKDISNSAIPCDNIHESLLGIKPTSTAPSKAPSTTPSYHPSTAPTSAPTLKPSNKPTSKPTKAPTVAPSYFPSSIPTISTTKKPFSPNYSFSFPICAKTNGAIVSYATNLGICGAYTSIKADIDAAVNKLKGDLFQISNLYGKSVRLAFHDAVDLDLTKPTDFNGADGCIGDALDSAGLIEENSPVFTIMEPIYQTYCDSINRADFIVLFSKFVIEKADATKTIKLSFQYGRKETRNCSSGIGRAPDAQDGVPAITQSFVTQMGLSYTDAVTLLGAHTLGHVHPESSGYDGHPGDAAKATDVTINAWDNSPTVFDNLYFVAVLQVPWAVIYNQLTDTTKSIWINMNCGANGGGNTYPTATSINICNAGPQSKVIALNTDMALFFPLNVSTVQNPPYATGWYLEHCVQGNTNNCYAPHGAHVNQVFRNEGFNQVTFTTWNDPTGNIMITLNELLPVATKYAASNTAFLTAFESSWVNMVTAGYGTVDGKGGKLGTLKSLSC